MADQLRTRTASVDETRAFAATLAELIEEGDVIVLGGDLGAGKTAFVQGLGRALGITDQIVSPTFTIERLYQGRVRLHHLDVYRLGHIHEALDLGLTEALDDGDVAVVEWGDAITEVLGLDYLHITLELGDGDDDRVISLIPYGSRWTDRGATLRRSVSSWRVQGADASTGSPESPGGSNAC